MKKLSILFLGLVLFGCTQNTEKRNDEKVIIDQLNKFITAIQDKNYDELKALTYDDFVIYENGLVWNFEQFSLKLEEYNDVNISYAVSDLHLIVDQSTALVQFLNKGTFVHPDTTINLNFIESAAFVKTDDIWKLKFYHSTHSK